MIDISEEILNSIVKNKINSQIVVFKNFCLDTPDWHDFINYLDLASKSLDQRLPQSPNDYEKTLGAVIVNDVKIQQNFYFYLAARHHINQASKEIEEKFSKIFKTEGGLSSLYINISSNISNIPPHTDAWDNFYWQCIGSTNWACGDNLYEVNPGDLVYIPAKTTHAVNFSMPRAAIGFSWPIENSDFFKKRTLNIDS